MTYPQEPPTAYFPPQPEPKKGKKAAGCLGIGCGGLVLIGIIVGIAAAVGGGKTTTNTTVAAAPSAASSAAAAPAATTKAAAPAKPAGPKTVLKIKGNGIKNTAKFTTGDSWTIHYTYDCSSFGSAGNFSVYVDYPNGDVPVNELGKKGSDSSTASGAGTHTLKVASECDWTLTVTDG